MSKDKTSSKTATSKSGKKSKTVKTDTIKAVKKNKTTKAEAAKPVKKSKIKKAEVAKPIKNSKDKKAAPKNKSKKTSANMQDILNDFIQEAPSAVQPQEVKVKQLVVLQVLPELNSGGVERGTIEIAKAGKGFGHEMLVASSGGCLAGQLETINAKHIKLPLASKNPFVILANIRRIRNIISKYNVDIVHARSRAPAWSAYFATKRSKCHFVTTFHGAYSIGNPIKRFYNSIMTKGEVVIAISEFIKNHITDKYIINEDKIRVIPRGVDLAQFTLEKVQKFRMINMADKYRIELDVPVILMPGRFTRWKGQSFLIDALSLIKSEKFVCILAGYDKKHENYYKELEKKVKEKGLFQKVRMIGEIKDMPALYSLSDIVISASTRPEAFGRITIEGQAMEKMVIATNHGGSCESVINGETGWLVAPGDTEEMAEVLRNLLNINTEKRLSITAKARKNIENNFSLDNMVKKTFAVYNEVLNGKKI